MFGTRQANCREAPRLKQRMGCAAGWGARWGTWLEEMCGGRTRLEDGNLYTWAERERTRHANYLEELAAYDRSRIAWDDSFGREYRQAWAQWEERRKTQQANDWEEPYAYHRSLTAWEHEREEQRNEQRRLVEAQNARDGNTDQDGDRLSRCGSVGSGVSSEPPSCGILVEGENAMN